LEPKIKKLLEEMTQKQIVEFDMSEYEKAGGSVRALVFDLFNPQQIKRKKHGASNPSSPK
jgi:hypothetical protein